MKKFYKFFLLLVIGAGIYLLLSPLGLIRDTHWQIVSYSAIAILELLSVVLLIKERRLGLYLLLISYLSLWVILSFSPEENPAAYVNIALLSILLILILVIGRKSILEQLRSGISYKKNKRYFLAASILIVVVCVLYCFHDKLVSLSLWNRGDSQMTFRLETDSDYQFHLSSTSLSLEELDYIERTAEKQGLNLDASYGDQINAIRHILVCLHSDYHHPGVLEDVIFLYSQDVSEQQRRILVWYMDGGEEISKKWEGLGSVNSLEQFYTLLNDE